MNDQEQPEDGIGPAAEEQVLAMGKVDEELEEDLVDEFEGEFEDGDDLDEVAAAEHVRSLMEEIFDEDDLGEVMSELDVLSLEDVAAYLKVEYGAVRRLIKEQGLPGRKIGEEWRFLRGAIADWLRAPGGNAPAPATAPAQEQREPNRPPLRERFSQEGQQGNRYPQQGGSRYPQQGGTRYPQENRPPRRPYQNEGGGQGYQGNQGGGQGYQSGQGYQGRGGGQGYPPPRRPRYGNEEDQGQASQNEYRPPRRPYAGQGGGGGQSGGQGGGSSAGSGSNGGQRFGGGPKKPKRKSLNEQRFNRLDRRKFGEEIPGDEGSQDSGD
ncbi:MAG: helix-turn-helix domain-containing protein [Planctomycetaceae bacterium]